MKPPFQLSAEISGKFKATGHLPCLVTPKGQLDFRTMTVDEAEYLLSIAPEYIERVQASKPKTRKLK